MEDLYTQLDRVDILERLYPLFEKGLLYVDRHTQKITAKSYLPWRTPWVFTNNRKETFCRLWREYLFDYFKDDMGAPPSGCQSCWKVVLRPQNLVKLMELKKYQKEKNLPSKCGIELRSYVEALYGGYYYNRSYEEGIECLKMVKKEIPDYEPYLKRGCTEMEHRFPNSHLWEVTDNVIHWEEQVNKWFDLPKVKVEQLQFVEDHVVKKWIKYAAKNGDKTYKNYTDGKNLYQQCVTYEEVKNG